MKYVSFKNMFRGITRNIIILGVVSLLTDLSGQLVFPLLPLYLTSVLLANATAVGLVEGTAEATASLLKVISGYWSDKIKKRKPFVFSGYFLSAIAKPFLALAGTWPLVLAVRVLDRVGKGLRDAPRDVILADSAEGRYRGKAYGFQRAMDGAGSVLGAVMAFLLLPIFGFKKLFLLAVIPGLISVAVIFLIKEKKETETAAAVQRKMSLKVDFGQLTRELKIFIIIATLFTLANYNYAFLMLRAKNLGYNNEQTIMLYVLFYLVYTLSSTWFGSLSDRVGRKPLMAAGFATFAAISLGLVLFPMKWAIAVAFLAYGIFFAMTDGTGRALVVDLAPNHLKGTALGTYYTMNGLAALPAGFVAGALWDKVSPSATFMFGFIVSMIALVMFQVMVKQSNITHNP